jgi:enoyl-CoA hydratase/carnithine racemase
MSAPDSASASPSDSASHSGSADGSVTAPASVAGSSLVTCTVTDGIAHVRLARPEKLNALTLQTLAELVSTAHVLRRDKTLRAVVLSGEGESFCAGLDFGAVLKNPVGIIGAFTPRPWRGTNTFQEACWAWRRLPVPVIAAVHGHCYGGGLQIALAADFRVATPDSEWSVLEARWGLIPDMTGIRSLAELVGIDTAKLLTMTARKISGKEARDLGLVTELAADPEHAALDLARELSGRSPDTVAAAKRLFDRTWTSSPRRTFARERLEQLFLLGNANTKAAREAAFAKVAPQFGPRTRR